MSRKKLKGFDPGNNNKVARAAYQKLQDGKTVYDQAPRLATLANPNRLSGASRRFAFQLIISQKLDIRDQERERVRLELLNSSSNPNAAHTNRPQPDYRIKLAESVAAATASKKKIADKEAKKKRDKEDHERKVEAAKLRKEKGAGRNNQNQNQNQSSSSSSSSSEPAAAGSSAISLSRSVAEQRQDKKDRQKAYIANAESEKKRNAESLAQAESAASASSAVPLTLHDQELASRPATVQFETTMREGESFRSYQNRLVAEKSARMEGEVRESRKINEKRKPKNGEAGSAAEARFQAERDELDASNPNRLIKKARTTATEFTEAIPIQFGEVVDRPPIITIIPKSKLLKPKIDSERIIASLLLNKPKFKKSFNKMNQEQKNELIATEKKRIQRIEQVKLVEQATVASLREQSIAAYKDAKRRRKESGMEDDGPTEKPQYIKKSILKKQKRNRERLQSFKDHQELEIDMEIERAGGYDD